MSTESETRSPKRSVSEQGRTYLLSCSAFILKIEQYTFHRLIAFSYENIVGDGHFLAYSKKIFRYIAYLRESLEEHSQGVRGLKIVRDIS